MRFVPRHVFDDCFKDKTGTILDDWNVIQQACVQPLVEVKKDGLQTAVEQVSKELAAMEERTKTLVTLENYKKAAENVPYSDLALTYFALGSGRLLSEIAKFNELGMLFISHLIAQMRRRDRPVVLYGRNDIVPVI